MLFRFKACRSGYALLFFCLFVGHFSLRAQQIGVDNSSPSGYVSLQHLLAPLNLQQVNTGYLLDRAYFFPDIVHYQGDTLHAQNRAEALHFGLAYARLAAAATQSAYSLPPLGPAAGSKDTIAIKTLLFACQRIHPEALTQGDLTVQNQQLHPAPGRNPYQNQTLFIAAPWTHQAASGDTLYFRIEAPLSNHNNIQAFQMDFSDGQGWRSLSAGQLVALPNPWTDSLLLRTRVRLSAGQWLYAHSLLRLAPQPLAARYDDPFTLDIPGATVTAITACPERRICKPMIVIEGFNAVIVGDSDFEGFRSSLAGSGGQTPIFNSMLNELETARYDIIYIDFNNGTAALEQNAEVVKAVIREVNRLKAENGCEQPNVVWGESMGGVLGKLALHEMEAAGEQHDCARLFTFDSPLRGANIPLAYQFLTDHIANWELGTVRVKDVVPMLADAESALLSEAAQDMLLYHYKHFPAMSPSFSALYQKLKDFGQLANCEHIAISNGSQTGNGQGFEPNARLVKIEGSASALLDECAGFSGFWAGVVGSLGALLGATATFDFEMRALPSPEQGTRMIYKGNAFVSLLGIPIALEHRKIEVGGTQPIDNAPGGAIDFGGNMPEVCGDVLQLDNARFCYIPTISAIEVGPFAGTNLPFMNPFTDVSDNEAVINAGMTTANRYVAIDDIPPSGAEPDDFNQQHLAFSTDNTGVMLYDLREMQAPFSPLTSTYNFGASAVTSYNYQQAPPFPFPFKQTPKVIRGTFNVETGGKLWINRGGRIGWTSITQNPQVLSPAVFEVRLDPKMTCAPASPAVVHIRQGGALGIGEWNAGIQNIGRLIVDENARVEVWPGGILTIDAKSSLQLLNGGICKIHDGGILQIKGDDGLVWIKNGGRLILEAGAIVKLDQKESSILVEGQLDWNGDIDFSGLGYFAFEPGHTLEFGSKATRFSLKGTPDNRFLRIRNSDLIIPDNISLRLTDGAVEYRGAAVLALGKNSAAACTNIRFYDESGSNAAMGLFGQHCGNIELSNCAFFGVAEPIHIEGGWGNPLGLADQVRISATTFEHFSQGIYIGGRNTVTFESCELDGVDATTYGIFSDDNFLFRMFNTQVYGIGSGIDYSIGAAGLLEDMNKKEAVRLRGGFAAWMAGGSIQNCDIGFGNRAVTAELQGLVHIPSNLFLSDQAKLENCAAGVSLEGDAHRGLIVASCAQFINNNFGISGRDVRMIVNAALLNDNPLFRPKGNTFVRQLWGPAAGHNRYIDVCYAQSNPGSISLANNFWGTPDVVSGNGFVAVSNPGAGISLTRGGACNTVQGYALQPTLDAVETDCGAGFCPNSDCKDDCLMPMPASDATVRATFLDGMDKLRTEDLQGATIDFGRVADLFVEEQPNTQSGACRMFIVAAHALMPSGGATMLQGKSNARSSLSMQRAEMQVFPNPARNILNIQAASGVMTVQVSDLLGRVVMERTFEGAIQIALDISGLGNGIFALKAIDTSGKTTGNQLFTKY